MTDRELLEEARELIVSMVDWNKAMLKIVGHTPDTGFQSAEDLLSRIDTALADHSPDAGNMGAVELAKAVEAAIKPKYVEAPNGRGGAIIISKDYSEAAALIEGYGRRVPRAWHEEIVYALKMAEKVCMDIKTRLTPYQFNTLTNVRKALDMMACIGIIDDEIEEEGE